MARLAARAPYWRALDSHCRLQGVSGGIYSGDIGLNSASMPGSIDPDDTHIVEPLVDGEMICASIYADLQKARRRIYISTWALEDNFLIQQGPGYKLTLGEFCKCALTTHPRLEIYILMWDWIGWAQRA